MENYEAIKESINDLSKSFNEIPWGTHWKSELTAYAVSQLEKLDYRSIIENIMTLPSLSERMNVALLFTDHLAEIIRTADELGGKLVNGSLGEWCVFAAQDICKMWDHIAKDETMTQTECDEISARVIGLLEHYAYCGNGKWKMKAAC